MDDHNETFIDVQIFVFHYLHYQKSKMHSVFLCRLFPDSFMLLDEFGQKTAICKSPFFGFFCFFIYIDLIRALLEIFRYLY